MDNKIKAIAQSGKTEFERAEMLMKSMAKVNLALLDYKYAYENYDGNKEVLMKDKLSTVKNTMANMLFDAEVYMETVGITELTRQKERSKVEKIAKIIIEKEKETW